MQYRNTELKVDALVSYLNDQKINLSPAFQRGHVWKLKQRRKLMANILNGKPIPAVFLYKDAEGSKYSYNIVDGKQRIESLILFISSGRPDFAIPRWDRYLFDKAARMQTAFAVDYQGKRCKLIDLPDEAVRDFREYAIPTIEITLDEDTTLDEIISLFVDINQQGEPVKRFDIAKAMCRSDPLLKSVFGLIAIEQRRGQDVHYVMKHNALTAVLARLQVIGKAENNNAKVDRMWERLLELALFCRNQRHRSYVDVLKEFMSKRQSPMPKCTAAEGKALQSVFDYVNSLPASLQSSKLLTDQTHFYTLLTSLLEKDLAAGIGKIELTKRIVRFAGHLEGNRASGPYAKILTAYQEQASRQTTHVNRRTQRGVLFQQIISLG